MCRCLAAVPRPHGRPFSRSMGETAQRSRRFAVEVQPRWRDVLCDRWPVVVQPQPDELLSSFMHRIAFANGLPARRFRDELGFGEGLWSPRLDLGPQPEMLRLLTDRTGLGSEIAAMTIGVEWRPLLLPLRCPVGRGRQARRRAAWLQYCPSCLADDARPYFRRRWRLATALACRRHGRQLLDRCPCCFSALAAFDQRAVVAQHLCACGFDLRLARAPRLPAAVRRAARLIDDLCRLEARAGLLERSELVERLMLLPSLFEPKGRRLTQLSSAERVASLSRAGDDLEHRLCKYLGHDADPAIAVWRSGVIAAGGCDALLRSLYRRLAPQRATARPAVARVCEPRTDLLSLVAAYRAVRARRQLLGEAGSASSDARSAHKIPQAR